MRAVVFDKFGGPEVLELREIETPQPGLGQVLIEVRYAGVNPIDWKIRRGYFESFFQYEFPVVTGFDVAGVVKDVGPDAGRFKPGDRVFGMNLFEPIRHGAYAELTIAPEAVLATLPDALSFADGAALPLASLTARHAVMDFGELESGQACLVHAAAGGVGSIAVQLAKNAGARVYGTASVKNRDYVMRLGLDHFIDYTAEDFTAVISAAEPDGLDLIVDAVGGETLGKAYPLLKTGGRLASLVDYPSDEIAQHHGVEAKFMGTVPDGEQLEDFASQFGRGDLKLPDLTEHPLEKAVGAQQQSEAGHARGKVVLAI